MRKKSKKKDDKDEARSRLLNPQKSGGKFPKKLKQAKSEKKPRHAGLFADCDGAPAVDSTALSLSE